MILAATTPTEPQCKVKAIDKLILEKKDRLQRVCFFSSIKGQWVAKWKGREEMRETERDREIDRQRERERERERESGGGGGGGGGGIRWSTNTGTHLEL